MTAAEQPAPGPAVEILSSLPPIIPANDFSLSCSYGADFVAARYCGWQSPPAPPRGIWQHGWVPRQYQFDPAAVLLGWGSYEEKKEQAWFWVARKDEEQYLRNEGYCRVKAIGLPLVYLGKRQQKRIERSLLVMPVHSLAYTEHAWNFEEYAGVIDGIRDQFSTVVVCLHSSCWERGYWMDAFRRRGYPVIQGAGHDRNALWRLQQLLSSFEFVTTNGYGSHLVYAAYFGAKPSIFGPYACFQEADFAGDPLYQDSPHILARTLEELSEPTLRRRYPSLFRDPAAAVTDIQWAHEELGEREKISPDEMRTLFGWGDPLSIFKGRTRQYLFLLNSLQRRAKSRLLRQLRS